LVAHFTPLCRDVVAVPVKDLILKGYFSIQVAQVKALYLARIIVPHVFELTNPWVPGVASTTGNTNAEQSVQYITQGSITLGKSSIRCMWLEYRVDQSW
jgi:hypothetical protein